MKFHLMATDSENAACGAVANRPDTFIYNEVGFNSHLATEYRCKKCEKILASKNLTPVKDEGRDKMPQHNYDDNIKDTDVEKSYAYLPGKEPVKDEGYTKGEWKAVELNDGAIEIWVEPLDVICYMQNAHPEVKANADLIASAPQLKADNERLLAENEDLKKYVDYAATKISFGSMPYTYENWVEVGKPDYE